MNRRAFTLIELLVVIAIIAILAAILFPVFAQAKMAAKKTADLSNTKQIGTSTKLYMGDYDDMYSQAYYYPNDNNSNGGYAQWSGVLQPYIKSWNIFVSPGDKIGGLAPTCYVGNNAGAGAPGGQTPQASCAGIQDIQAPRLSYVANSLLMPRKRRTADPMNVVSESVLESPSGTILIGAMTDIPACINGTSTASGVAFKSHRPTNAILLSDNGQPFQGEAAAEVGLSSYFAISAARAKADIASCTGGTPAAGLSHITYLSPERFGNGSNYVFSDTSAKFHQLARTLDPANFLWGKRAYTAGGGAILAPGTTTPVQ